MSARELQVHVAGDEVLLWQAHSHAVADEALRRGSFGGPSWSLRHTSRLRTSLSSLFARAERGDKAGRERFLAVWIRRPAFDAWLVQAVPADFEPGGVYASPAAWRLATRFAQVTVSWHADVDASGAERGGLTPRFGVRERALETLSDPASVRLEDWTQRVAEGDFGPAPSRYPMTDALTDQLAGRR